MRGLATGASTWSSNGDTDAGLALTIALLYGPAVDLPQDHTVDAGNVSWVFAVPEVDITHVALQSADHSVNAGDASWSFAITEPTITYTAAPGTLLTLADFDNTGLDVDAAALLVASAPGTTGSNPYADSDRGGSDSPLEGELGLSSTDTVISRIRRHSATELNLNDNDNPSALSLLGYFGVGGDGNDLNPLFANCRWVSELCSCHSVGGGWRKLCSVYHAS